MTAEDLTAVLKATEEEVSKLALPEWSEEAKQAMRAARRGKNTFVIVGFAPTSRHLAPFDEPKYDDAGGCIEIIGLNEAHRHQASFMKRWDRWAQFHSDWDFSKQASQATIDHWKWLQEPHDFPIYMQKVDPRVPASVRYPLEEITKTILGKTLQWTLDGGEEVKRYFTSSFSYQAALALYEKMAGIKDWQRVEVFGYEMATFTEFTYQKGSTEWWLGKLDGHGIEVVIPPRCRLLSGALYGYEVSRVINRDMLEKMLLEERNKEREAVKLASMSTGKRMAYEELLLGVNKGLDAVNGADPNRRLELMARKLEYAENGRGHFQEEIENVRKVNLQFGRTQELDDLIAYTKKAQPQMESAGISDPLINRQMLEFRMNSVRIAEQQSMTRVLMDRGHREAYQQLYGDATVEMQQQYQVQGGKAFERELNNASMTNALMGRRGMITDLMKFIDNYDPDDKIVKMLIDADPLKKVEGQ